MFVKRIITACMCIAFLTAVAAPVFAERKEKAPPHYEEERKAPPKKKRSTTRSSDRQHKSSSSDNGDSEDDSLFIELMTLIITANAQTTYGDYPYADEGFVFSFLNPLRTDKFWTLNVGISGIWMPEYQTGGTKIEFRGNVLPFLGIIAEGYGSTGTFCGLGGYSYTDNWQWSSRLGLSLPIIQGQHVLWSVFVQYAAEYTEEHRDGILVGSIIDLYPIKPVSIKYKGLMAMFGNCSFSEWELTAGIMLGGLECYVGGSFTGQADEPYDSIGQYFAELDSTIVAGVRYYF